MPSLRASIGRYVSDTKPYRDTEVSAIRITGIEYRPQDCVRTKPGARALRFLQRIRRICIYPFRRQDSCRCFWRHVPPKRAVFIATFSFGIGEYCIKPIWIEPNLAEIYDFLHMPMDTDIGIWSVSYLGKPNYVLY